VKEIPQRIVFATGCFDLFHLGHLQFLEQAKSLGDRLIVGVNTDERIIAYKGVPPIYPLHHRLRMIAALSCVDVAVPIDGLKDETGVVLMGVTHRVIAPGHMDLPHHRKIREKMEAAGVQYIMVPRTPGISTSAIKEKCYEELANRSGLSGDSNWGILGDNPCGEAME
jgi:D-beta-D-heptose 7-phosphate kinase/D-beta-D-heptose 1-phosphate adenosyltransferase